MHRRDFLAIPAAAAIAAQIEAGNAPSTPADLPRDIKPLGADLGCNYADLDRVAQSKRPGLSFLEPRFRDVDAWRKEARAKVFDVLQYRPEKVDPNPQVLSRVDRGDFIQEKIVFSTTPHFRVPAYVLIPKKAKQPAPAIVDLHSHGGMFLFGKEKVIDLGRNHDAMVDYHQRNYDGRPTATELVRRGFVVISIDAFMFGERRTLLDVDQKYGYDRAKYSLADVKYLNGQCRGRETTLAKSMCLAGLTWPGVVFWDDIRTVDYLITRPEVDPQRIGCVGISMGGYRSLFLGGLDDRIRAACVVGFMSTTLPMMLAHVDTHSWVHFLPGLHQWLDWPDVAAMRAPLPLFVQQCEKDRLFPLDGMRASLERMSAIYEKAGHKGRFVGKFYDAPHVFNRAMQDEAFDWFAKNL